MSCTHFSIVYIHRQLIGKKCHSDSQIYLDSCRSRASIAFAHKPIHRVADKFELTPSQLSDIWSWCRFAYVRSMNILYSIQILTIYVFGFIIMLCFLFDRNVGTITLHSLRKINVLFVKCTLDSLLTTYLTFFRLFLFPLLWAHFCWEKLSFLWFVDKLNKYYWCNEAILIKYEKNYKNKNISRWFLIMRY